MKPKQASRTAEYMALFRAMESARPRSRRLFDDPFARHFLRPPLRFAVQVARIPFVGAAIPLLLDRRWPGTRAAGVARTRLIDEWLIDATRNGACQIVILGAGFDCRAYRLAVLATVKVIEVDHPDTSHAKRETLTRLLGSLPTNVRYATVDFNVQSLEEAMRNTALDATAPTCLLWEGVTNYLTAEAVDATFRSLAGLATHGTVIFTCIDRSALETSHGFADTGSVNQALRRAGENWTFGFDPNALSGYLLDRGFRLEEDLDSVQFRARYMGVSPRVLGGYEFYHVARAERVAT